MEGTRHLLALALTAALLLTACGGDDNKTPSASGTAAPTQATAAARAVTTTTTTATETARQATATAGSGQTERVVAADCFKSIKAYRYEGKIQLKLSQSSTALVPGLELNDVSFSGAYVAPDRSQFKMDIAGTTIESVTIGRDTWSRFGGSGWIKSTDANLAFSPNDFCEANLQDLDKANVRPTKERVNGIDALRYEFDRKALARLNNLFGDAADLLELPDNTKMTLWVTEKERWPLRMTLTGDKTGADPYSINLQFNITDLNKDGIKIEPPQ